MEGVHVVVVVLETRSVGSNGNGGSGSGQGRQRAIGSAAAVVLGRTGDAATSFHNGMLLGGAVVWQWVLNNGHIVGVDSG